MCEGVSLLVEDVKGCKKGRAILTKNPTAASRRNMLRPGRNMPAPAVNTPAPVWSSRASAPEQTIMPAPGRRKNAANAKSCCAP